MKSDKINQIYWLLFQATMAAKQRVHRVGEEAGLTIMQTHALMRMSPEQPRAMSSLSELLHCDASNITGIVDRLEAHDLIKRLSNPDDRRVTMVALTPKGQALQTRVLEELGKLENEQLRKALSADEIQNLRTMLQKIVDFSD